MSFQNKINLSPAQGWHGDFSSTNPRISLLGKDGAFQVGPAGIGAGSFVWVDEQHGIVLNTGSNSPAGFVARELANSTMPVSYEHTMIIPAGTMVTVFTKGEFIIELPVTISAVKQGEDIFVSTETGEIVTADSKNAVTTNYKYAENAKGGDLVKISAWI